MLLKGLPNLDICYLKKDYYFLKTDDLVSLVNLFFYLSFLYYFLYANYNNTFNHTNLIPFLLKKLPI